MDHEKQKKLVEIWKQSKDYEECKKIIEEYKQSRGMKSGDKCKNCNKGYIDLIIKPASLGGSALSIFTLGLACTDEERFYKCTHCKKIYNLRGEEE